MRANPRTTYAHKRCAQTQAFRIRMQAAEKKAKKARKKAKAAEAEMEAMRAEIMAERAALTAFIGSPAWERDLLALARDRVRAELLELALTHKSCQECGSFGRGMYDGFLSGEIARITEATGLPPLDAAAPMDWPVRMGQPIRRGRTLDQRWMRGRAAKQRAHGHDMGANLEPDRPEWRIENPKRQLSAY